MSCQVEKNNQLLTDPMEIPRRSLGLENVEAKGFSKTEVEERNSLTNILVVEDDKGLNQLIQRTLSRLDFKTDGALTGKGAIKKVTENRQTLLLLDYILPDMTAKQVIETLTKKKCEVPFIVMTGQGDEKIAVEMMKLGARDYLIKDGTLIEILPKITKKIWNELDQEKRLQEAERALRESKEKYSILVEQAMDGVIIVQDESFKFANTAMADITGYSVGEIIGMPFLNIIAPESGRLMEERKRLQMAGIIGPSFYEAKILCKNGTVKDAELSVGFIQYNDKPANMGIIRDVTERKQAEKTLRESQEMYKTLVNTSPDSVTMTDLNGIITYLSPRTLELHGYECAEELLGKTAFDLIAPADHEKAKNNLEKTLKNGVIRNLHYTFLKKNNSQFKGSLNAALIKDSFGKPKGLIATTRDITKQKQMEEDLKRYAEHLEEEVKQRTNELIQSEKMAALGQLVAGVAHEVNNPLGYLKSNTELIKKNLKKLKESNKEKRLNIKIIEKFEHQIDSNLNGIGKITTIMKTLKRFSKPDSRGMAVADINQGIQDTLVIIHNQLKNRIEVIEDFGKLPVVKCNIGQLNQVFMNLLLNASQAMDKGKIWIRTWGDENFIYIEIKDNGEGIPDDKINKIFDPFFTTKDMGTGLGLSISYRIIKNHNGEILVESMEDEGTRMVIKLNVR